MAGKPYSLYSVYFPESNPVEEACEDVKRPLHHIRLGLKDESISGIKICRQVPYQQVKPLHTLLGCRHHRHPVADDGAHNHIGECGGQRVSLCHSTIPFEWEAKVSAGPGHHGQPVPVCPKDPECLGDDPMCFENIEACVPIQGIILIMEV